MDLLRSLNWRYATRRYDPGRKVPQEALERILEAVRLTATSNGLQPFEVLVVANAALRERIRPLAMGQAQVVDCSHLLVFAAWDDYTAERINHMFDLTNQVRGGTSAGWESVRRRLLDTFPARGAEANFEHAARQVYIALGTALVAAASEQVDSTPMEGFDPDGLDRLLGLRERGLRSVALLPLGYRLAEADGLSRLRKVRRPREQFVTEIE